MDFINEYGEFKKKKYKNDIKVPISITPDGQKFSIGDTVKIVNPITWFSKERNGRLFRVQFSFYQKYGHLLNNKLERHKKEYCLKDLKTDCILTWFKEEELELVK